MIYIAPVQGHTDAAWRHFHHEVYGGDNLYFTPFIRCERGELRRHDLKDYTSDLNENHRLEPQVIFRDMEELDILISRLHDAGAREINLNMGCPFPLQTGKGRGAGFVANTGEAERLPEILSRYPDISFSAKMRLGFKESDEWKGIIGTLNSIPFRFIAMHPRVARQQYGGDLWLDSFAEFLEQSVNPVVFNGEIRTPADITASLGRFPKAAGAMTARGILGRPSLAAEHTGGAEWDHGKRIETMLRFHRLLLNHYSESLCGDAQILSKIKPFWEYAEEEIGRDAWKAIRKAVNMAKYHSAVAKIKK